MQDYRARFDVVCVGIIFQPDTPYKPGTDDQLLKWKFLDTVTVDLQVVETGDGAIRLVCAGPEGMQIDCSSRYPLDRMDIYRIRADCAVRGFIACRVY